MKRIVLTATIAAAASLLSTNARAASWYELSSTCATNISGSDGNHPWAVGCSGGDGNGNYPILWIDTYSTSNGANTWYNVSSDGQSVSAGTESSTVYVWRTLADGEVDRGTSTGNTTVSWTTELSSGSAFTATALPGDAKNELYYTSRTGAGTGWEFWWINVSTSSTSQCSGSGEFFTVGAGGGLLAEASDNVYQMSTCGGSWTQESGVTAYNQMWSVAGYSSAAVYAVTSHGDVELWSGSSWASTSFPSGYSASQVSVGTNGYVWAIDTAGDVWTYQ
jgi:hypothetical protein